MTWAWLIARLIIGAGGVWMTLVHGAPENWMGLEHGREAHGVLFGLILGMSIEQIFARLAPEAAPMREG